MGSLPWFSYCIRLWKQRVYFSKPSRKFAVWELPLKSKPWAWKQKGKVSGSIYGRFGLLKAWKPCLLGRRGKGRLKGHSRPSGLSHLCSLPLLWTLRGVPLPTLAAPLLTLQGTCHEVGSAPEHQVASGLGLQRCQDLRAEICPGLGLVSPFGSARGSGLGAGVGEHRRPSWEALACKSPGRKALV